MYRVSLVGDAEPFAAVHDLVRRYPDLVLDAAERRVVPRGKRLVQNMLAKAEPPPRGEAQPRPLPGEAGQEGGEADDEPPLDVDGPEQDAPGAGPGALGWLDVGDGQGRFLHASPVHGGMYPVVRRGYPGGSPLPSARHLRPAPRTPFPLRLPRPGAEPIFESWRDEEFGRRNEPAAGGGVLVPFELTVGCISRAFARPRPSWPHVGSGPRAT